MKTPPSDRPQRATARLWLFRAGAALGIPAALFLAVEGGLRVAGYGRSADFLIPDDRPGFFRTNPDFVSLFLPPNFELRPLSFRVAERKPPNTVRIVVLGESAAQGVPAPAFAFAPQLRAQLRARYPGRAIEVINTGIVAINSHVVYRIARDLADFSPDLFVVYMGNNEVVGPYGPGCAYLSDMPPLWVIRLSVLLRSTRTGQLVGAALGRITRAGHRPVEWGGMAMFVDHAVTGDDPRLEDVYRNFEANLRDIVRTATAAGAKTLLCTVVSNLKDCPPFLSRHRAELPPAELAAWQQAFTKGRLEWLLGEAAPAQLDLGEAWRIDPHYADTAFMLGTLELQAGDTPAGRQHLVEARHWDALRFRPDARINEIIRAVAGRGAADVTLVDAASVLGSDPVSTAPPAGREFLWEHVHLNWDGNHRLGLLLAQGAETALFGQVKDQPAWLDSAGCAAAVAYTVHEQLTTLQKTVEIVRNPPFTNQLTYGEDQAKLAREFVRVEAAAHDPENLRRAKLTVQTAAANDPENPALAAIAEGLETDLGNTAAALVQARRAAQRLPAELALQADEASLLGQLGQFPEAEKILQQAVRTAGDPDKVAPSFAALYARMKRFAEGRGYLDQAIARHPADARLRLMRGNLARLAGDLPAAERELRAILAEEPGNQDVLEALVSLLAGAGQTAAVEQASLALAEQQIKNQQNNLRVAALQEARGDTAQTIRYLTAAELSGPATAAVELRLARKLYAQRQWEDLMLHLARARRLSIIEEDPESAESINQLVARVRAEMR